MHLIILFHFVAINAACLCSLLTHTKVLIHSLTLTTLALKGRLTPSLVKVEISL